ncbi:two-component sensor histidine kinase [Pseudomonas sp. PA15(2017)]|uniref:heavy metal sensor histidine kinase n=1 Tax=Pseudomonas sp. PA15(2017) TaxID=1932111 RepID=UPI000962F396|nr:heavy metal sensor histidine kinase [Pseudomonas sp. PA15(2017)]OLU23251.1 two-component sensor histidine kinase [Pseudomonas sp. PA15(2017)]
MKPFSLALRVALNVVIVGALLITLLIAMCYWVLLREADAQTREELTTKAAQIVNGLSEDLTVRKWRSWQHEITGAVAGHEDLSVRVTHVETGETLLSVGFLGASQAPLTASLDDGALYPWKRSDGIEMLTVRRSIQLPGLPPMVLQMTQDLSAKQRLVKAFLRSALGAVPVILLLTGLAGWLVAQQGLQPLRRFSALAAKVSARDLSPRIPTDRLPPELQALAQSLNLMLHRLDTDVQKLSDFSDEAAHELRAPLNNLMVRAQVALSRERADEEYKDALASSVEELERLSLIVSDMLFLAQVSHADMQLAFEEISLRDEADRVSNFFLMLAEEREINLLIEGVASVKGDRLMIQRAISNLLSNALRHAAPGSTVRLSITPAAQYGAALSICNTGEDIEAEHLPHLFKRFYRIGKRASGSTGLGLAIVRSIMSLHGGQASVTSAAGKTCFTLTFAYTR